MTPKEENGETLGKMYKRKKKKLAYIFFWEMLRALAKEYKRKYYFRNCVLYLLKVEKVFF